MINGTIPPEEYPLEFQGKSLAALTGELVAMEQAAEEFGASGAGSKEQQDRKAELAIHGAVNQQIELRHAMEHHHDFIENGMFGREKLETFSSMLDNDGYWDYLNDPKNKEEREKVRDQHFDAMTQAIKDKERSVFDMSPREADLQGEENMSRLRNTELEVILQDAPPEQHAEITENHNAAFETKFGYRAVRTDANLVAAFQADSQLTSSAELNLSEGDKALQGEANIQRIQSDEDSRDDERNPPSESMIRTDLTKATIEADGRPATGKANGTSVSEVAVVAASSADEIDDNSFSMLNFDSMDIPDEVKLVAAQHSKTVETFRAGAHEADSSPPVQNFEEANKVLAEKTQGGVEETGIQEPDLSYAQNAKPVTEPSISVS